MSDPETTPYGTATLTPEEDVVAGSYRTWTITYRAGRFGMDDGSALKVAFSQTSDWGTPQFDDPAADNYATVETTGDASVAGRYEDKGHTRPFKTCVVVDVFDGSLAPGDEVTLTLGATGGGSMGHQAQSFVESPYELRVLVDPIRTGEFLPVGDPLTFDVVAGPATSLTAVVDAATAPDEPATLSVRAEDFWGNVATGFEGSLDVSIHDLGDADDSGDSGDADDSGDSGDVDDSRADHALPDAVELEDGVGTASVSFAEPGVYRLAVADETRELDALSNPTDFRPDGEREGGRRTYWGDLHGQSGETVGSGTIQQYFDYARDAAFLDFASHAGNDFQITDEFWETIQSTIRAFNDPGAFVTFLCYEWSANTPLGGDHNVYFRGDAAEIRRSSNWLTAEGDAKTEGTNTAEELYETYSGRDDVLIIPHQGGRPATLDAYDPDLTPFVEINSVWGVFEWFGREALERGYEVGFVGGTDDHSGRPGVAHPDNLAKHNVRGGLMGVTAPDLTRESLWDAFEARRVYATTGARALLDVAVAGEPMGAEATVTDGSPVPVSVAVNGTAPVRRVDCFRGSELIASRSFAGEGDGDRTAGGAGADGAAGDGVRVVELTWSGARGTGRDKVVDWSGGCTLSAGEIRDVEAFGFHRPTQGVADSRPESVEWDATTTGNYQGVRLTVDAPADAELAVRTRPVSESFALADLDGSGGPKRIAAEGLDCELVIRETGAATAFDVDCRFEDDATESGTHPYYVRVRQDDGHMAWSSPVFVTVE